MNALGLLAGVIFGLFRSRHSLLLENLALHQQLATLKRRHPRPRLGAVDKLFWVVARRFWSGWQQALIIVSPDTVVRWHRAGFQLYWRLISKAKRPVGRHRISKEVRNLIFQMVAENPTWGAPRIHGELLMLGFDICERTISRWMRRAPRDPERVKRWLAFLRNHRDVVAAMDFFTVPTITFGVLYCSSLSTTVGGACCTSMSRGIPQAPGLCSSCEKPSHMNRLLDFSSLIGMPNMAWRFR